MWEIGEIVMKGEMGITGIKPEPVPEKASAVFQGTCKGGFTNAKRTHSVSFIRTNGLNASGEIIAVYCGIYALLTHSKQHSP
jgi:hypothetical protein